MIGNLREARRLSPARSGARARPAQIGRSRANDCASAASDFNQSPLAEGLACTREPGCRGEAASR